MAGTSYTRQSTLTDGDTITASLFNAEYNQLVSAFSYAASGTTGHQHDGSAGEGGNIEIIGDQDFKNKIVVDSTNNRWSVYVEVGGSAVEQVRIEDGVVYPVTDSDVDLGTDALRFKAAYIDSITATTSLTLGTSITVSSILDEDDMSSDSATALATQQSIKAYVDAQVTAQDLDLTDGTTSISIDLDSEALSVLGGTGIDSTASGNGVTLAIDSTVATLTGTQTLTNKTLTSPDVNTPDIDGGTIDGTVIGGTTAAAGSFTTVGATGNITVGGTVDGRDVAADGTKLDTVETNADVTDTTNVTAAGALMDSEVTNLAQVKAFDSADYATAAQGTTADAALPRTGGAMTGAITTNSTFDGRDVATDGTKLDGIEASADVTDTANVTAAGALMDSELTSIASVKALDQGVATTDSPQFVGITSTSNVIVGGDLTVNGTTTTLNTATLDVEDKNITINYGAGDTTGSANGAGITIQDAVDASTDATILWDTTNDEFDFSHPINVTGTSVFASLDISGEITANGGIALGDNDKATFGASDDLQLYHNGSDSYVKDIGAGNLYIDSSDTIIRANGTENSAKFIGNGRVELYYDAVKKFETTSTGIDVTGTATMGGGSISGNLLVGASSASAKLTVGTFGDTARAAQFHGGSILIDGGAASEILIGDGNVAYMSIQTTDNATAMKIRNHSGNADLVTIERASGNVGIGNSAPLGKLTISNAAGTNAPSTVTAANTYLQLGSDDYGPSNNGKFMIGFGFTDATNTNSPAYIGYEEASTSGDTYGDLTFYTRSVTTDTAPTERMRISSSGNVGIGTSSPAVPLAISATTGAITTTSSTGTNIVYNAMLNSGGGLYLGLEGNTGGGIFSGSSAYDALFGHTGAYKMHFVTSNTIRATIDSSGNVGIGTSSPSKGLHLNFSNDLAAIRFQNTANAKVWDLTPSIPDVANSGFSLHNVTDNTIALHVDNSNNVGIGTSSPNAVADLHVADTSDARIWLDATSADTMELYSGTGVGMFNRSNSYLMLGTNNTERMRIDSSGSVSIGTSSDFGKLRIEDTGWSSGSPYGTVAYILGGDVNDANWGHLLVSQSGTTTGSGGKISFGANGDNPIAGIKAYYAGATYGHLDFYTRPSGGTSTQRMRIDSSGRVGIGTSSPSSYTGASANTLVVGTNVGNNGITIVGGTTGYASLAFADSAGAGTTADYSGLIQYYHNTDNMNFFTGGSERMRIDSSGTLRTTSSDGTAPTIGTGCVSIWGRSNSSSTGILRLYKTGDDGRVVDFYRTGNTFVGHISVTSTSTSYNTSSDYRLKEDLQPMSGATDRLKELKPCNFAWKVDGSRVDGFLAHEAQEVVPEAVSGEKDAMKDEEYEVTPAVLDDDGNVVTEAVMGTRSVPDYQGIDQSKLVPLLVATIQELEARITQLENN